MTDYSPGMIYRIVDKTTGKTYIGSTLNSLQNRLKRLEAQHRSHCKGKQAYTTSFEVLKNGDYTISLVQDFPCETKADLLNREHYFITHTTNVSNKYRPNQVARCGGVQRYMRAYMEEYMKKIMRCPCGGSYSAQNKTRHNRSQKHLTTITVCVEC